jgi:hypothetical protein
MRFCALLLWLLASPAYAETTTAPGALLRWLDKLSGDTEDLAMRAGDTLDRGQMNAVIRQMTLHQMRLHI